MEFPEYEEMTGSLVGPEITATIQLTTENDQLRAEVRRLRLQCEKLQESGRRQETHISILTRTCEQLVEELESSEEKHLPDRGLTLLTPPSSGRTSCSSLSSSADDHFFCYPSPTASSTGAQHHMEETTLPCHRCQSLEEELAKTMHEMKALDRQLQCAAKQKFQLQERLCNFEEDIGILVQKGLSHKLT